MKKLISVLLCIVLLFNCIARFSPNRRAYAATRQELESEINRIDSELKKNRQMLNELKSKKEAQQLYLDASKKQMEITDRKAANLREQIKTVDGEIDKTNDKIKKLNGEIGSISSEVEHAEKQIETTTEKINLSKDELSESLRAAYITKNNSTLKLFIGAKSLASFFTRLEMMKRMSERERAMIVDFSNEVKLLKDSTKTLEKKQVELNSKLEEVEKTKLKLDGEKAELDKKQKAYEKTIKKLDTQSKRISEYISRLDKNGAVYESYIKTLESERKAADRQIEEIIRSYQSAVKPTQPSSAENIGTAQSNPHTASPSEIYSSNAAWAWPLGNAPSYMNSPFGYRDPRISGWDFHGGIDIIGTAGNPIKGKPIYASRAGTVILASWGTRGYGNHIAIDHGDGYSTVYAHCLKLSVTTGQRVSKGQLIAYVGESGNVTGPHLHFEVRYYGVKQNPAGFVSHP